MKLIILAAAVLYVAEASVLSHLARRSSRNCESYIDQCVAPLTQYEHVFSDINSASQLDAQLLDRLCGDMATVMACAGDAGSVCGSSEMSEHIAAMTAMVSYMCSPDGRATVLQMLQSPCATNPALGNRLQGVFQDCLQSFQMEITMFMMSAMDGSVQDPSAHICPLLEEFRVCSVEGTRSMCGNAFATFVQRIWDIVMEQQLVGQDLSCPTTARRARSLMSGAINFLNRRSLQ